MKICSLGLFARVSAVATTLAVACGQEAGSPIFPDARDVPLPGWTGPVFVLSQDYPKTPSAPTALPWANIDFRKEWQRYLRAILQYAFEGNLEIDWNVAKNPVRKWYHAPWMHWGRNGREFVHGLTHERVSQPGELAPSQTSVFQNWAVGFYNDIGAHTIYRVWRNPDSPNVDEARFANGTVGLKLLFTQATPEQVPYLQGAKEWDAYIYESTVIPTNPLLKRNIQKLRLLQIDVAVRDAGADSTTGWVFGTFTYNGNLPGNDPWKKFVPVGLMWGNDPGIGAIAVRNGTTLKESISYTSVDVPYQHLGWAGRLNGPVDNPTSSCLSCHSTAQWELAAKALPPPNVQPDSEEWMQWFRNIKPGDAFSPGSKSLDYSLQNSTS